MFRGLLGVHSRFGLHVRRVAQGDPLHRRLRWLRLLHHRSDCYRLERPAAGWVSHPLEIAAFARLTKPLILWSRHPDLNRGPTVYKTVALPLSYAGGGRGTDGADPGG